MLRDILGELAGMFVDDLRLAGATAAVIAAAVASRFVFGLPPLVTAAILVVGILGVMAESVLRAQHRR